MSKFWHSYKAEFIKNRHSIFLWIHIALPFLLVFLITFICFNRVGKINNLSLYETFFKMIGFSFPLLIAILCALITNQEKLAGNYQMMLGKLPYKPISFISQICMLLTMCFASVFLAIILFIISMKLILHVDNINYLLFCITGALIFFSSIILYNLYLTFAYHFNTGICIIIGFSGVIISALAATGLGDNVWIFLPWVWSIRLINFMTAFQFKIQGALPIQYSYYTLNHMNTGLLYIGLITILSVFLYIFPLYFWEGRQK